MTLDADDIVWAFDGRDGRGDGLRNMIELYAAQVVGVTERWCARWKVLNSFG